MEKLVQDTGEAAHLALLNKDHVVYLQKVESPNDSYLLSHEGKQNSIHATSTGQVLLAYQSPCEIEKALSMELKLYTSQTITNPSELKERLIKIRKQGYAYSKEELHYGYTSLAAPIRSSSGKVKYAVSIAGPTARISAHRIPELIKAANELTIR